MSRNKIAVIGAGSVGATIADNLSIKGSVSDIVLVDVNREKAEAECQDILHGLPLGKPWRFARQDTVNAPMRKS